MKKILPGIFTLVIGNISFAQNSFPTSGDVWLTETDSTKKLQLNFTNSGIANSLFIVGMAGSNYPVENHRNSNIVESYTDLHIGAALNGNIYFETGRNSAQAPVKMILQNNGNLGLGTVNPENAEGWNKVLEVRSTGSSKSLVSTANVISGLWSHEWGFYGAPAGGISGTYTNHPFSFITNKLSRMTITNDGRVGIGTSAPPSNYKLAVAGNIIAEQVRVQLQSSGWPDYVFKPEYKLMSLNQVEHYIHEKGHLPEMPSAEVVAKEGVELGNTQALLLKKIEELTLHLIQMEKRNNEQDKEIERLKIKLQSK